MNRCRECWSDLPSDLLISIYERLGTQTDTLNFKLVCKVWLNSTTFSSHRPLNLLSSIFPSKFKLDSEIRKGFLPFDPELVVPCSILVVQSLVDSELQPWLCFVEEFKPGKFLVRRPDCVTRFSSDIQKNFTSLYSRVKQVGSFYTLGNRFSGSLSMGYYKVVLIADPIRKTFCSRVYDYNIILLNHYGGLQMISTKHRTIRDRYKNSEYDDVINFKGNVYVIDRKGRVFAMDYKLGRLHKVVSQGVSSGLENEDRKKRLVVSSTGDELYLVRRSPSNMKRHFQLYKLNEMKNKWEEVRGIGARRILIVTLDRCLFAFTKDFLGWRGNSIVFRTGDFPDYARNSAASRADNEIFREGFQFRICVKIGVFSFEDGECNLAHNSYLFWPPRDFLLTKEQEEQSFNYYKQKFYETRILQQLCLVF